MSSAVGGGGWFVIGGIVTFDCATGLEEGTRREEQYLFYKGKIQRKQNLAILHGKNPTCTAGFIGLYRWCRGCRGSVGREEVDIRLEQKNSM